MTLVVHVEGVGVIGPGFDGWSATRAALAGEAPWQAAASVIPPVTLLAANERRRAGLLVRSSLAVAEQAVEMSGRAAASLPSIFTSSSGDGVNCHTICETLASDDRSISPTRFHNSVHNAPAGYWTIATQSMTASTSLCAHDASFAAGRLDACVQVASGADAVLLVASDSGYPEPLNGVRPISDVFAIGLVLASAPSERTVARLSLQLEPTATGAADRTRLDHVGWESVRSTIPAARALNLLLALANAGTTAEPVHIDYLDTLDLIAEVSR
ncbi:beta-ketoacyl synthase chain length factor [soil metagenome]